jgi:hypothetical protein
LKDRVVSSSDKVEPSKIDNIVLGCEGVAQAGVAGIPTSYFDAAQDGERHFLPRAFVLKRDGYKLTAEDVVNYVKGTTWPPNFG